MIRAAVAHLGTEPQKEYLTSHLVVLNVAVEVRPIQQESFPDLNMRNRPLPNQVPYGPNGTR
jgi:hypothetical protein